MELAQLSRSKERKGPGGVPSRRDSPHPRDGTAKTVAADPRVALLAAQLTSLVMEILESPQDSEPKGLCKVLFSAASNGIVAPVELCASVGAVVARMPASGDLAEPRNIVHFTRAIWALESFGCAAESQLW